jgi:hypothetical protein
VPATFEMKFREAQSRTCKVEVNITRKSLMILIAVAFATLGASNARLLEEIAYGRKAFV